MLLLGACQDLRSQHLWGLRWPSLMLTIGRMAASVALGVASSCRPVAPPCLVHQLPWGDQECLRAELGVQTSLPLKGQGAGRGPREALWFRPAPAGQETAWVSGGAGGTQDTLVTRGLGSPASFSDLRPPSVATMPSVMLRYPHPWLSP